MGHKALLTLVTLAFLFSLAGAQELKSNSSSQVPKPAAAHIGIPQDWSQSHFAFTGLATVPRDADPRVRSAFAQHRGRANAAAFWAHPSSPHSKRNRAAQVDWNVSLGSSAAELPQFGYPAKYSFDVNSMPDCSNDFVVYGLAVAGTPTQGNMVAFNNLYSSGVSSTGGGFCDANNNGQPSTLFSFNVTTQANGFVIGSTALSLDGKKIAFVEFSSSGTYFHVLTWGTGGGTVTAPLTPDPACVTSCLVSILLPGGGRTPYIDYATDSAYVSELGTGRIAKIDNVFDGTPMLATSDPNWPSSGECQTLATGAFGLNPAFLVNGRLYATEFQQVLHIVTPGPTCSTASDVQVTLGTGDGTVVDSPLFSVQDATHGSVFVFARDSVTPNTKVYQIDLDGNLLQTVTVVADGGEPPVAGQFDNTYWSDPTASSGYLYFPSTNSNFGNEAAVHRVQFSGSTTMNATADASSINFSSSGGVVISSMVEIYNPTNVASPDTLFIQGSQHCGTLFVGDSAGCVRAFDLSNAPFTAGPAVDEGGSMDNLGGMVVDNVADPNTFGQASSIYFAVPGKAIKLTQSALN